MIALDTNILLYACDTRDPKKQEVALSLIESTQDGLLLWQVACEFLAAARKLNSQSFTPEQAWDRLEEFAALLTLVAPSPSVLSRARPLATASGIQFWDAMIYAACLEIGATRLYSEDLPGRAIAGLEIVNPFRAG